MKKALFIALAALLFIGCNYVTRLPSGDYYASGYVYPKEGVPPAMIEHKEKAHRLAREFCPEYEVVDERFDPDYFTYQIIFRCPE